MSKRFHVWMMIAVLLFAAAGMAGCGSGQKSTPQQSGQPAAEPEATPSEAPTSSGDVTELKIEDIKVGTGREAKAGDTVTVHYTGWLTDGTKFDSSVDKGEPFTFALGQGQVIPGWDKGVEGMKVGGKRKLTIPPDMGYGAQGAGGVIPPNATLVFDVELLNVQ